MLNCECLTGKIHSIIGAQPTLCTGSLVSERLLIMLLGPADNNNNPDNRMQRSLFHGSGGVARRRRGGKVVCGHRRVYFLE